MNAFTVNIPVCYLLTFAPGDIAVALGRVGDHTILWRWTSRFCGAAPGACTLSASDADQLLVAVERLLRRHRAALAGVSPEPS